MKHLSSTTLTATNRVTKLASVRRISARMASLVVGAVLCTMQLSCSKGFDSGNMVNSLRVLSSRADKPYAKPGEDVTVSLLVADERADKSTPLVTGFIPIQCQNPQSDLYYLCFVPPTAGSAIGTGTAAGASGLSQLQPGQDLTNALVQGSSYRFTTPKDAIVKHPKVDTPYGLTILFWVACAGRIVYQPASTRTPSAIPLQCIVRGEPAPTSDYVFGLTRVYEYETRTNANPEITQLKVDGEVFSAADGVTFDACDSETASECPEKKIEVVVPDGAQEIAEGETAEDGSALREQIWAAYFSSVGEFDNDARLLFDSQSGRVSDTADTFRPKGKPGSAGRAWVVAHDSRGGANWVEFPVHLR